MLFKIGGKMEFADKKIEKELENVSLKTLLVIRDSALTASHNETNIIQQNKFSLLFNCVTKILLKKTKEI